MSRKIKKIHPPTLLEDLGTHFAKENSILKRRYGLYLCSCGNKFKADVSNVKRGNTASCGCYSKKRTTEVFSTHGLSGHPLYRIWANIITRTTSQKSNRFYIYWGRGIVMCSEWRNDFKSFYDFAINSGWRKGLQIDRIDNDKGYRPDNCRFVSAAINSQNRRRLKSNNTSGYRGVSWYKNSNKWVVSITVNKKRISLGYYNTAIEAAKVYDKYVIDNNLHHIHNGVL